MKKNNGLNNAIIATFMGGFKFHPETVEVGMEYADNVWKVTNKKYEKGYCYHLLFHSSWDWLMPVVAKCGELFDEAYLHANESDEFFWDHYHEGKYFIMEYPTIKQTYKDVVKFIKWYNKQK